MRPFFRSVATIAVLLLVSAGSMPAWSQPTVAGKTAQPDAILALLERVAGGDGRTHPKIFVAALPAAWPQSIPLPLGLTVVGSIVRSLNDGESTQIFYDAHGYAAQAAETYGGRLRTAGWTETNPLSSFQGGFTPQLPSTRSFCATDGRPTIVVSEPAVAGTGNLSVTVSTSHGAALQCNSGGPLALLGQVRGPLPKFVAPQGTRMTSGALGLRLGASGAKLVSTAPLGTLIDAFADQMIAARWQKLDLTIGKLAASASFTYTDAHATPWEAVITIYAAPSRPNTYYSLVDVTNLAADEAPPNSSSVGVPQ